MTLFFLCFFRTCLFIYLPLAHFSCTLNLIFLLFVYLIKSSLKSEVKSPSILRKPNRPFLSLLFFFFFFFPILFFNFLDLSWLISSTMINGKDIYDVLSAIVPLYVAMLLAYGSVRWWKIFSPDQCAGINRFVAVFAVPLLSFHFISTNDPYMMNYRFIAADSLQKLVILTALFLWNAFTKTGSLEWVITLFSLCTLPNTLVMGIPLLQAMYGEFSGSLMVQIVVLQSVIWYTLMLFLFEYRGAKLLIAEQFPETAGSITSFRVDSDVVSLNGREPLQADAEIGDDGKLHVVVRRSSAASSMVSSFNKTHGMNSLTSMTPRASNLTGVEIYSVQSSREPTPRASSFNQTDFYAMFASKAPSPKHGYTNSFHGDVYSLQSSKGATPRTSNFDEEMLKINAKKRGGRSMSGELFNGGLPSYPPPNPMFASGSTSGSVGGGTRRKENGGGGASISAGTTTPNKELHMFVWSSSTASPVSEGNMRHAVQKGGSTDLAAMDAKQENAASRGKNSEYGAVLVIYLSFLHNFIDRKTQKFPTVTFCHRRYIFIFFF